MTRAPEGPIRIDERVKEFATPTEQRRIDLLNELGTYRKVADAEGVKSPNAIQQSIAAALAKAARAGMAPGHFEHGVAPGFQMGKVTVQRAGDGTVERTWERQSPEEEMRHQALLAAIREECANAARLKLLPAPKRTLAHLLNLYVFTDYHLGMRAWSEEGGADWDLETAERLILQAFQHMIASAPAASVGFIGQLGDFMHFDGLRPVTPTSGHIVDAAASYQQIVRVCIRLLRALVDLALQKHERVVLLCAEGNHDLGSSAWMRELAVVLFAADPRISILNNGKPYYAYRWGKTMLGFTHGHGAKFDTWPITFASHFAEMWGATTKRYAHGGHLHHEIAKHERHGMKCIQHPTLAPNDRHSALGGYSSERQAIVFTYDDRFGEMGSNVFTPQMLAA